MFTTLYFEDKVKPIIIPYFQANISLRMPITVDLIIGDAYLYSVGNFYKRRASAVLWRLFDHISHI